MAGLRRRGRGDEGEVLVAEPVPVPNGNGSSGSNGARKGWTRIGELLVKHEFVNPDDLQRALLEQEGQNGNGKRLGALLVEHGALEERHLTLALADQAGIALVDLRRERPDPAALATLPEALAPRSARGAAAIRRGRTRDRRLRPGS